MANEREVFTVLEASTGEGKAWVKQVVGGAVAAVDFAPVITGVDKDGNFALIPVEEKGQAVGNAVAVLPVEDASGNLQYIQARDEGDAASGVDALPTFIGTDPSGNFRWASFNADGELLISNQPSGTKLSGAATVLGVLSTATEVLAITLTSSKVYERLQYNVNATHTMYWEFFNVDDYGVTDTETLVWSTMTGPGQFVDKELLEDLEFTAGSTGVQKLVIKGTQLHGKATDMNASATIMEKP
jgi:hypothetical protein